MQNPRSDGSISADGDHPKGYRPELLEDWPVEGDLVVPLEALPESLKESMGAEWRLRRKNRKVLEEQSRE